MDWQQIFTILSFIALASVLSAVFILMIAVRQMRNIDIPEDADFAQTLRLTPFFVVLGLDLLDLGLDMFAAPISWVLLDRMGLKALRTMSTVEAIIPGTQFIPTLTLCWVGVRLFKNLF